MASTYTGAAGLPIACNTCSDPHTACISLDPACVDARRRILRAEARARGPLPVRPNPADDCAGAHHCRKEWRDRGAADRDVAARLRDMASAVERSGLHAAAGLFRQAAAALEEWPLDKAPAPPLLNGHDQSKAIGCWLQAPLGQEVAGLALEPPPKNAASDWNGRTSFAQPVSAQRPVAGWSDCGPAEGA